MLTILIADDEPHLRLLVSATLAAADCRLLQASDGDEAWRLLSTERPQVAVLDVMMPGKTGLELTRAVRAEETLAGMRIILLTAKNQPGDAVLGRQAGADLYLTKPFSPLTLLNAVTCEFAVPAGQAPTSSGEGLHLPAGGSGPDQRWRAAVTVHADPAPAEPAPATPAWVTATPYGPHWPGAFVDERRLWEVLGYTSQPAISDSDATRRLGLLARRLADATVAGHIKRFVARDPNGGAVVARGYRREDVSRLLARAQPQAVSRP